MNTHKKVTPPNLNLDWINRKPLGKVIAVGIDYYKLFYLLKKKYNSAYLFESLALPRHEDRYFAIGFEPAAELIANGNNLEIRGDKDTMRNLCNTDNQNISFETNNPYNYLRDTIKLDYAGTPRLGGLIGYFSYEAVNYFEPILSLEEHKDFDNFHLGLYLDGLLYDSTTDELYYYSYHDDRSAMVVDLISGLDEVEIPMKLDGFSSKGHTLSKDQHNKVVNDMLEEIKRGNIFQIEVGYKNKYKIQGDKIAVYSKLREVNPSPYMFYVKFNNQELMGASPEVLITAVDGDVLTTPTAGTTRRSKHPRADKSLVRELMNDPKEVAEHNMLVDLHRNDISKICVPGSVKVTDLKYLIRYSHVQHIVSDIRGVLKKDTTGYDVLASILPGGVLTGAPKIEAMKLISNNESEPRGPYGGAVGRLSMTGDAIFCLPIRSLFCAGDECFTQTSGGIVYDSVPEKEYEEIGHKLAAMETTLQSLKDES